jgi:hypothetical protein
MCINHAPTPIPNHASTMHQTLARHIVIDVNSQCHYGVMMSSYEENPEEST